MPTYLFLRDLYPNDEGAKRQAEAGKKEGKYAKIT